MSSVNTSSRREFLTSALSTGVVLSTTDALGRYFLPKRELEEIKPDEGIELLIGKIKEIVKPALVDKGHNGGAYSVYNFYVPLRKGLNVIRHPKFMMDSSSVLGGLPEKDARFRLTYYCSDNGEIDIWRDVVFIDFRLKGNGPIWKTKDSKGKTETHRPEDIYFKGTDIGLDGWKGRPFFEETVHTNMGRILTGNLRSLNKRDQHLARRNFIDVTEIGNNILDKL